MRGLAFLSILGLAAATSQLHKGECLVDSGEAVSDAMDASLFIWAANKRCGKQGQDIKCSIDVSSAIKSVNSMINVILNAVDKCGDLHTQNKKCGLTAGKLTEHTAALAAAAAMVAQKCPAVNAAQAVGLGAVAGPVMCTVNLKNTMKHLFHATKALTRNQHECHHAHSHKCASNGLDIAASLSGFGAFLAGSVGQCKRATNGKADTRKSLCAQAAAALAETTLKVSKDGLELADACKVAESRLFTQSGELGIQTKFEQEGDSTSKTSTMMVTALAALLPVTAIASFVGGRAYAARRSPREVVPDHE